MKSIDIKNILSKIRIPKRKEFRTISSKAQHDWKMILILFFLLSIVFVISNTLLFFRIDRGEIFVKPVEDGQNEEFISGKNLEDAVNFFEDRSIRFERLKLEKPTTVDPSL